jgi:hypothetical protein
MVVFKETYYGVEVELVVFNFVYKGVDVWFYYINKALFYEF